MKVEHMIAKFLFHSFFDIDHQFDQLTEDEKRIFGNEENFRQVITWITRHEGDYSK